jgi:hypothetical protein
LVRVNERARVRVSACACARASAHPTHLGNYRPESRTALGRQYPVHWHKRRVDFALLRGFSLSARGRALYSHCAATGLFRARAGLFVLVAGCLCARSLQRTELGNNPCLLKQTSGPLKPWAVHLHLHLSRRHRLQPQTDVALCPREAQRRAQSAVTSSSVPNRRTFQEARAR